MKTESIVNDRGSLFVCEETMDENGNAINAKIIRSVTPKDLCTIPFHKKWGELLIVPLGVIFTE